MTTVLVGEDTDLLILLCCYANTNGHNIYSSPSKKRIQRSIVCGTKLGEQICSNVLFSMQILVVTQLLTSMALGRVLQ